MVQARPMSRLDVAEQYASLPATLKLRELRYHIAIKGFARRDQPWSQRFIDAATLSAEELASLYQRRWTIETSFRHLKDHHEDGSSQVRDGQWRAERVGGLRADLQLVRLVDAGSLTATRGRSGSHQFH